jgi:isoamylase
MQVWPGTPYPLGATYDGSGTNFALFSEVAEKVELCLFDTDGTEQRIEMPEMDGFVWHAFLPQIEPGQQYGYRVYGPNDPSLGQRCNPNKLLLDPYAKAVNGDFEWHQSLFGYQFGDPDQRNDDDSAAYMPKSVVISPFFDWGNDRPPRRQYADSVIYEAHVKGLTMTHPDIPEDMRGTYAAISHPAMMKHLADLGVTAIELMPVHHFANDSTLQDKGLANYWGYNTISFLAPDPKYAFARNPGGQVQEFKAMVRTLHEHGIEVILDVVYNHTAEGNHLGPTICFRGIDNAAYYRLVEGDLKHYMDYTGTGNTLNVRQPHSLQLIMDSLRYWVTEMHVDGFRFDLAATLAREFYDVDRLSSFFELVQQDPIVSQVKLIAEPWDVGPGGYQVGNFPPQWTEWNGKYRDTVRDFWRGEPATLGEFAGRFTGSADLYAHSGRRPVASINFVTCHDGFTLLDLVSYNEKHNDANGEGNNDGESHNRSWNCGVEGPTDDTKIVAMRDQQRRNFITTVLLSQGVPMICHGDELGRTQLGNNNGYCQDNATTWIDWSTKDTGLIEFTGRVAALRKDHPVFRRRRFFDGRPVSRRGTDALPDIGWFRPDGTEMTEQDWDSGFGKAIAVYLNGDGIPDRDTRGERMQDDTFLVCFSAHDQPIEFHLPTSDYGQQWKVVLDTADSEVPPVQLVEAEGLISIGPRAIVVLQRTVVVEGAPQPVTARTVKQSLETEPARLTPPHAWAEMVAAKERIAPRTPTPTVAPPSAAPPEGGRAK